MIADVSVRPAATPDFDAVSLIWAQSTMSMDGWSGEVVDAAELRGRIDAKLLDDWRLLVAEDRGRIIGMLAIKLQSGWLDHLFVAPTEQGRGVGRALLQRAKQEMPEGFTLRAWKTNLRARCFYEREGLKLTRESLHPRWGYPVCYYAHGP
jgi:GNAT superfamily N-acetyltransferase